MLFAISKVVRNLLCDISRALDGLVYGLISTFYQVFNAVSKVSLYGSSNEKINELTDRIYVILGVAMLFVLAYNIILLIMNPDNANKGEKTVQGLLKNFVISIVLLTLLPTVFDYMTKLQNDIIDSHVIENIILGNSNASEYDNKGDDIATMIYSTFYHPIDSNDNPVSYDECEDSSKSTICSDYRTAYNNGKVNVKKFIHDEKLADALNAAKPTMELMYFISTAAGIVAVLMFISYALDIGIRIAKLVFLQIIAPIPVILRVTKPSGGIFDKWVKKLIETYMTLFLRLITIYFSMYMIQFISNGFEAGGIFANAGSMSGIVKLFARLVVIIGILLFAKEAPKLLEELAGNLNGGGGFSPKDIGKKIAGVTGAPLVGGALGAAGALAGRGIGAGAGAVGGAWSALRNNARLAIGGKGAEGLTHMDVAAAAKQGARLGTKNGGGLKQFNSQSSKVYEQTYGYGKKQGVLGGKSIGTRLDEKYSKAYENNVKQHAENEANDYIDENIRPQIPQDSNGMNTLNNEYANANKAFESSDIYTQAVDFVNNEVPGASNLPVEEKKAKINERLSQIAATTTNADEKRAIESYLKRKDITEYYDSSVLSGNKDAVAKIKTEADVQAKKAVQLEIANKGGIQAVITDATIKSNLENNAKSNVSTMLNQVHGDVSKLDLTDDQKKEINSRLSTAVNGQITAAGGIANISLTTDQMNLVDSKVKTALNSKITEAGGVSNITLSSEKQAILDSKQSVYEQHANSRIQTMVDQSFTTADEDRIRQEVLSGNSGIVFSSSSDVEQAVKDRIKREKQNKFQEFTEKFFDSFVGEEKSKEHDVLAVEQMREEHGDIFKERATKEVLAEPLVDSTIKDYLFEEEYQKEVEDEFSKKIEKDMLDKAKKDAMDGLTDKVEEYFVGCAEGTYSDEKDGKRDKKYNARFKSNRDYANANIKTKSAEDLAWEKIKKTVLSQDDKGKTDNKSGSKDDKK